MTEPNADTFTIYLNSGLALVANSGVYLLPDKTGTLTFARWQASIPVPIKFKDPTHWFCAISEAIYQTPTDPTSSVIVTANFVNSTIFGNQSTQTIGRIPAPQYPGTLISGPPDYYNLANLGAGSWPVPYIQTTTIIPWSQVSSGSIAQVEIEFDDNTGATISAPVSSGNAFTLAITFKYFGAKSF